jgi:hypothetical protein
MGDLVVMQDDRTGDNWVMDRPDIPNPLPDGWREVGPWNPSTFGVAGFNLRGSPPNSAERLSAAVVRMMRANLVRVRNPEKDRIEVWHRDDVPKDWKPLGPWSP